MAEKKDAKKTSMFDGALFYRHLNKLHDSWLQNKDLWGGADALVITAGSQTESTELTKTQALQSWLLSYELPDTVMIITPQKCTFLASSKKVKLLKDMQETVETKETVVLELLQRGKVQDDDFALLIKELKKSNGGKTMGTMTAEVPQGEFGEAWWKLLLDTFSTVDIGAAVSTLFAVKDKQEQKWMKTASSIVSAVVKSHMIPEIETIIDEEKQVVHRKIADKIEKLFVNPEQISKALKPEVVDSCFTPVIQSGGTYALTAADGLRSETLDSIVTLPLHSSCIIIALGGKYKQYCGVLARTLLVNPTSEQRAQYEFLFDLHNQLIELMRPGVKMSDIYRKAHEEVSNKYPQLVDNFLANCGYGIGLELTERGYMIDENNDSVIEDGMTFNVRIGFQDLELNPPSSDPKANRYALLLSDTILVTKEAVETLTKSKKKFSEISYSISAAPAKPAKAVKEEAKSDEDEDEPSEESADEPRVKKARATEEAGHRPSLRHRDPKDVATTAVDEKRKANQARLAELQAKQARERYLKEKNKGGDEDDKQDNSLANKDYTSYKSHSEYPLSADREKIYIDSEHDSILLPIHGLLVPFHITTVKSVQKTEEYIRIIFKAPGNVINMNAEQNSAFKDPQAVYVKEVTFRVPNARALSNHLRLINELKKRVTQRESEKETLAGLKVQEELQVTMRGKPPKLSTLSIRPTLGGRKTVGTLEAHQNGFRFLTAKKGKVDIIYKNIKHAFFQPAEKELIVLIHLRLHNAIMIGKKKTLDVQFFTEVMEVSQALGGVNRRLGRDAEELEDEQREREMRNKLNAEFQNFVKKVEELGVGLEFDIPYRELGFYGVPERNNVFLQPTVHCLVNLTESPFFVLTLDEIEIAYFERVRFSLRNFDVVLVLKDWAKPVVHLNAVPVESLEMIKEWLDSCNIKYYEGVASLNWKRVMQQIRDNPKKFWKDGGWSFLEADSDEEEAGEEEESQDYNPSGSAESEDYEGTDSGSSAGGSGSDDDDDSGSAMIEEEEDEEADDGEDWDDLEARAAAEDKKLAVKRKERGGTFSDDEDEPPRKKKK